MMERGKDRDRISGIQVVAIISSTIIGAGIMSFPNNVAHKVTVDGTIVVVLSGLLVLAITFMIAYLAKKFPQSTIFDYSSSLVGRFLGKGITGIMLIYFLLVSASVVRIFANVIKLFLLEKTPIEIIILSFLILSTYLVKNGINPIARICEAFFPIIIISLSILLILSLQNFNIKEFYSMWQIDVVEIIKAIPTTLLSYLGFEVLLIIPAFMMEPDKVIKCGIIGTGVAVIVYIATEVMTMGVFTLEDLRYLLYPTLELAKSISFPGAFAERFDIFYAVFWVLAVFTTFAVYHYLSAYSLTRLIGLKNYRPFCYLLMPIIYFISLLPKNISYVQQISKLVSYFGAIVVIVIPLFLLSAAAIRKRRVKLHEDT